jgi:hypothetical protein
VEIDELRSRIDCRRRLSIPPRAASRAVMQLRRDAPGARRRWSLGERGSFEMQADAVAVGPVRAANNHLHIAGRLWDPAGTTMTGVDVEVCPVADEAVEVAISPAQRLPEWFRDHDLEHWHDLARAALDELCEELLWYASRPDGDGDGDGDGGAAAEA